MIIKAHNIITRICDDADINFQNYQESIEYISNLYKFIDEIKQIVPLSKVTFLPSFKGKYVVEQLGIPSNAKENEMKVFKLCSAMFLEEEIIDRIRKEVTICEDVLHVGEVMVFTMK